MQQCKDNANEPQLISLEKKNYIKRMAMKQVFYAQLFKIRRKYLIFTASNKNKHEAKFKFQGLYARSQCLIILK